jgi:hypothetical protein
MASIFIYDDHCFLRLALNNKWHGPSVFHCKWGDFNFPELWTSRWLFVKLCCTKEINHHWGDGKLTLETKSMSSTFDLWKKIFGHGNRELYFVQNHGGRQRWGFKNRMEPPNMYGKKLKSLYFSSKVMNPFTRAPAPFYRETMGLLHSNIALGSKEYSKWEHVHECLLHPVIYRAHFRYLQVCHSFTPRTQTYDIAPLTRSVRDSCLHSWRSLSV